MGGVPEVTEAGGEDDEGRPVVRCGAGVHERCLERGERGAIGASVRSPTRGFAALCRLDRDGFQVGVRASRPVPRDGQMVAGAPWLGKRSVEELELPDFIGARGRSVRSHCHAHMLPWRPCQSLANNSPHAASQSAEHHLEPKRRVANAPALSTYPCTYDRRRPPRVADAFCGAIYLDSRRDTDASSMRNSIRP